jgi:quercetin dioxygenase-like cupin family protein
MARGRVHPYVRYLREHHPSYTQWRDRQGVPVVTGHFVGDMRQVELGPWPERQGRGAFLNLSDQEVDDAYLLEIPAGGVTAPRRHLYEELVYVLEGRGASSIWNPGEEPRHFEWQAGSLFAIPLNAFHQHFGGSRHDRALLLGVTSAPIMINLFLDEDFILNCPYVFRRRFSGESDYFEGGQRGFSSEGVKDLIVETNFVADVRRLELPQWEEQGKGLRIAFLAMAGGTMKIHLADFEVGTYKKAHRHGPGAHILILDGRGYTLMWKPGERPARYEWQEGSFISPPAGWYHQHFNTGATPAKHLAFHRTQAVYQRDESHQIEYEDEDPAIRQEYAAELERRGVALRM